MNGMMIFCLYYEKQYLSDNEMLKFYTEIGMFNGTMDYDLYEQLCRKLLTINT